ncbi:MAG TPA: IS21 family transposase [Actinomycetales bacterium]|nr:IS21 family transposase [Actinomycetales bacterium]
MILDAESWMNVRRFRALHEKGVPLAVIARECGCDWRTVKKYLAADADPVPPAAPPRSGTQPRLLTPLVPVVEAWLRADIALKGTVVHERLVAEHGFAGSYQRVKMLLAELRPRLAAELAERDENPLAGLHRRFEIVPGGQAQVDWGDEGDLLAHVGVPHVYSFHMVLSYSRDPFCCFTTSMDLATFFDCHRRAFAHFGGVPGSIVYDRTKTVVRRHVAPGVAVPLHPQAAAFAEHYGFVIDVLAAYRPTGKGRVERQVNIVRQHVLAGRTFASLTEIDAAFAAWLPLRRALTHRTHGQVIADRAAVDRGALGPLPAIPYLVADRHLRRVGKDCLVSFEASLYSVPATLVRPGQRVEIRAGTDTVAIHALDVDGGKALTVHPRARAKGAWVVDQAHWDGLPDGRGRATTLEVPPPASPATAAQEPAVAPSPLDTLLASAPAVTVTARPLADYEAAAGLTSTAPAASLGASR